MNEAILERLDKIVEQLGLANALSMLIFMPNMSDFRLVLDWQDEGGNSGDGAPEKGKKQRLTPKAVCRIVPDE